MKKVILNKCFGGFDVSKKGYELYAKKKGLSLYWYENIDFKSNTYEKDTNDNLFKTCFTKDFGDEAIISNENYEKYSLYLRDDYREDATLIEVVEELKGEASGRLGDLKIVEIPDNLEYEMDEYDGIETLHQKVETW